MQHENQSSDPLVLQLSRKPQDGLVRILRAVLSDMHESLARYRERVVFESSSLGKTVRPPQGEP